MAKLLTSILMVFSLLTSLSSLAAESSEGGLLSPYYQITEPFTINFATQSQQKVRFLQVKVALKSHDQAIIQSAEVNLPMIQDALRVLFTDQNYQTVSTVAGRQQLQQQALERVRQLLVEETGNDGLEQVYFTRFILQ